MDHDSLAREVQIAGVTVETQTPAIDLVDHGLIDAVISNTLPQHVKDLITRLLLGTEPAELKYWENDKFSAEHVNIAILRASGLKPKEIVQATGMSFSRISVILHHPYTKKLIAAIVPERSGRVLDIRTRMEIYASDLLDKTYEEAMECKDLDKLGKVGFGLLDRVGHGPINKSVSASVPASAFGGEGQGGDDRALGRLATAMEESNRLDRELMPTFKSQRPPEEGALPAGSEIGLGGSRQDHEVERRVPSSAPTSQAEAAD